MARRKHVSRGGWMRRIDPFTSLLLVFPLFLVYELGILLVPSAYNGADLITAQLVALLHGRVGTYLAVNGALAGIFLFVVLVLRKKHRFDPGMAGPLLLESGLYAITMGTLICFVMVDLLHIDPRLALLPARAGAATSAGLLGSVIVSIGAGVHEELIFRVVLFGGIFWALDGLLGRSRWFSFAVAVLVSSALFSAAHHVIGGEPFRVGAFVYRLLCGVFFASLYQYRGLAVAVYTHTLYDVYVFVFG